jgi:MFS family permease
MTLLVDNIEAGTLGRAMGSVSMAMVIGCMAGPLLGGVLYEYGSYYAPFALSFGLLAVSFVLRLALIESRYTKQSLDHDSTQISPIAYNNGDEHEPQEKEHVQGVENGRNSVGPHSTCITNLSPESTYASSGILSPQLCGCLVILLRSPRMITVLWVYLVTSVTTTAFDSFLPLFVRDIFGWKQTAQGLVFITLIIPNLLDVVSGYIIDRIPKSRRYLTAGAFLFSVPLIVCLRFIDQNSLQDKVLLCALLALIGLCMGVTQSPITVELSCLVLEMETRYPDVFGKGGAVALAYGLLNSSFALGSTIAPFMGGYLRDRVGWATMCLVLAMPAGVSGLLVLIFFGK